MPWTIPNAQQATNACIACVLDDGEGLSKLVVDSEMPEALHRELYELFDPETRRNYAKRGGQRQKDLADALFNHEVDAQRTFRFLKEWKEQVAQEWNEKALDAVICPPAPFPAIHHEYAGKVRSYTVLRLKLLRLPSFAAKSTQLGDCLTR